MNSFKPIKSDQEWHEELNEVLNIPNLLKNIQGKKERLRELGIPDYVIESHCEDVIMTEEERAEKRRKEKEAAWEYSKRKAKELEREDRRKCREMGIPFKSVFDFKRKPRKGAGEECSVPYWDPVIQRLINESRQM